MRAQHIASIAAAILFNLGAAAQVPQSPSQLHGITAQGPQRQQPPAPGRSTAYPIAQSPGTLPQVRILNGSLMGYVYWDASRISYNVNAPCSGFSVTVSTGTVPNGQPTFEQFTPLGTYNNVFTSKGKTGNYEVCAYSLDHLPIRTDLQLVIHPSSSNFKTAVVPVVPPTANWKTPIQIPGDNCPHILLSPLSAELLGNGWTSCGDGVYNVNFLLQPPQSLAGLTSAASTTQSKTQTPLASSTGALRNQGQVGSQQMLLSQPGQTGMLSQGALQNPGAMNPVPVQTSPIASPASGRNAAQLNPQPLSPKSISSIASPAGAPTAKAIAKTAPLRTFRLSAPQQSRKITNPNAAIQNSQIIAVLQNQTKAAEAEIAAMKLSLHPAGVQVGTGPSQTMASTTAGGSPVGAAPAQANLLASNTAPTTHSSIGAVLPAQFHSLVVTCSYDPTMRVLTVSGGQTPAIFTQDAKYNFYTISGCSFGDPGPNAKAYIYSQGNFREDFQIEEWTDNWLKLSIDPNLKGIDDQDNVTLVIQRADGKQASKSGFRFYAARQTILLPNIPQRYFSLDRFRLDSSVTNSWKPIYTSGSSASVVPNLPNLSAEVQWTLTTDPDGSVVGGSDIYDFSHLHPTFALQDALMEWKDVSCDPSNEVFAASKDNWGIDWYETSGVKVVWQGQTCNPKPGSCGGGGFPVQPDCFVYPPETNYGVDIWVTGPRGIDPWTGKPTA